MYLKAGEQLTLEALLYGLLLVSGNDAAEAIAGYCAGDSETFAAWMNEKAARAGDGAQPFHQPQRPEREGALLHRRRHGPLGPGGAGARNPGPHRQHPIRLGGGALPHQPQQAAVAV